ncbi:MAG: hypothetical protein N2255_04980 [Kiritimatiellae bacterium]|nr:hypothetical protein [Kiritimatiellia bacterium]
MNRKVLHLVVFGVGLLVCSVVKGESWVLVKITDHDQSVQYSIVSSEEYKQLQDEIAQESRFFQKALSAAEREWRSNEENKNKVFPRGAISPRKVDSLGTFTDRKLAEDRLNQLQTRDAERELREKEKERERYRRRNMDAAEIRREEARQREREQERDILYKTARELFKTKLREAMEEAKKKESPQPVAGK